MRRECRQPGVAVCVGLAALVVAGATAGCATSVHLGGEDSRSRPEVPPESIATQERVYGPDKKYDDRTPEFINTNVELRLNGRVQAAEWNPDRAGQPTRVALGLGASVNYLLPMSTPGHYSGIWGAYPAWAVGTDVGFEVLEADWGGDGAAGLGELHAEAFGMWRPWVGLGAGYQFEPRTGRHGPRVTVTALEFLSTTVARENDGAWTVSLDVSFRWLFAFQSPSSN